MSAEVITVFVLLVAAVVLFATERMPVDLVALLLMSALLLSGIVTPAEGVAGFSNVATVTVGAMFVLSAGLFKTGAVNFVGGALTRLGRRNLWLALLSIMLGVGAVSAFINNTAAVAIFLPVMLGLAQSLRVSPSKLLMPLSFASMLGGVCTLIGTSTNIVVSSIAERHGQPPFRMFEFLPLGLAVLGCGVLYMLAVGVRLIPARRTGEDLTQNFRMDEYLTDIVLLPESRSVGTSLGSSPLVRELNITVLEIFRGAERLSVPDPETVLAAGDVLRVRADVREIGALQVRVGVRLKPGMKWREADLESAEAALVEAVVAPNAVLMGSTLEELKFRNTFGATVLAIRHHGELLRGNLGDTPLRAGDVLLTEVRRDHLDRLKRGRAFVIVSEVESPEFRKNKIVPALLIVFAVVASAALGVFPIVVGSVAGAALLIVTGCVTLEEAYAAIEWRIIFLLAGVLTLGTALENTGAAGLLSGALLSAVGEWGPVAVVSGLFLMTGLLTNVMSNNASAALLAPVAIATADSLGVGARPLLMAVTFAASLSFMTPVGYQTNTLISGPGQYRFGDFLRVGTPLSVILWLLCSLLIPVFWPF